MLYGNNATFSVVASGTTPFTYQWRKAGVALVNGAVTNAATLSGATGATLTLTSITSADAGNYDVVVTNSVASAAATAAAADSSASAFTSASCAACRASASPSAGGLWPNIAAVSPRQKSA